MPEYDECEDCGEVHGPQPAFPRFMDHMRDVISGGQLVAREGVQLAGIDVTVVAVYYPGIDQVSPFAIALSEELLDLLEADDGEYEDEMGPHVCPQCADEEANQILANTDLDAPIPFIALPPRPDNSNDKE